jgi:hypothetical protein
VAEHVEGPFGLVRGHHVAGVVDQHEPEVAGNLGPARDLPVDGPGLLLRALPLRDAHPVEPVEVVENTGGVDHEVVLAVVEQHLHAALEEGDHVAGVAGGDVLGECVIDHVAAGDVIDIVGDAQAALAVVEEGDEGLVWLPVLPEVVGAHAPPVLVAGVVVVGEEVEELGGLA